LKSTNVHLKSDYKPKTNTNFKWMNIVKPLYERMRKDSNYLSDIETKKQMSLTKLGNKQKFAFLNVSEEPYKKRNKTSDDESPLSNQSLNWSPPLYSNINNGENLIHFDTSTTHNQEGTSLYKDVKSNTQLVYYDDPNELVKRLNLLISSQNAGNTGVNNEIYLY